MNHSTVRFLAVLTLLAMVVAAIAVPTVAYRLAERRYPRITDNAALTAVGLLVLAAAAVIAVWYFVRFLEWLTH